MHNAAQYASERASSVSTYVSASLCETAWYAPIGRPNCSRLFACSTPSARARLATPTASRASAARARRRVAAMIFAAAGGAASSRASSSSKVTRARRRVASTGSRTRTSRRAARRAGGPLEHDPLFDKAQAGTTLRLRERRAGPSTTGELWPGRAVPAIRRRRDLREAREGITLLEERAGLRAELVLLRREAEVHQRLRGRPSTRSAMMFRRISDVPASMVLPRLRRC